jgi:hypothetical protein
MTLGCFLSDRNSSVIFVTLKCWAYYSIQYHLVENLEGGKYCTVLYCTVLYCTVLYCTILYCTVLYCTVCPLKRRTRSCSCHFCFLMADYIFYNACYCTTVMTNMMFYELHKIYRVLFALFNSHAV